MKSFLATIVFAAAALVSGCAVHQQALVLDQIGPSGIQPVTIGPKGALLVYSAYDPNSDLDDVPYICQYTDYRILTEEGKLLLVVHNNDGSVMGGPRKVELPAGKFRVVARAKGYKAVTVPVVISPEQLTIVHLEGGIYWPDNAALLRSEPVRLPNGEIAGWRATTETDTKP